VSDGHGGVVATNLNIDVTGANDAPGNIQGVRTGLVVESAPDGRLLLANGAARGTYDVAADAAGRLVLLGEAAYPPPPESSGGFGGPTPIVVLQPTKTLHRLNADGSRDASFGSNGSVRVDYLMDALAIDAAGNHVLGRTGNFAGTSAAQNDFQLARYTATGQLDLGFGNSGKLLVDIEGGTDTLSQIVALADGKLLLAGTTDMARGKVLAIVRVDAAGQLDAGFGGGDGKQVLALPGQQMPGWQLVAQDDGSFLAWGTHRLASGEQLVQIVRHGADGAVDTGYGTDGVATFSLGTWYANRAADLVVDDAGRALLGWGMFDGDSAVGYRPMLTRFNADGSVDTGFTSDGSGTADTMVGIRYGADFDLAFDAQGGLLLSAELGVAGNEDFTLLRFEANGARDMGFGELGIVTTDISGGDDTARDILALAGGDVVLAGGALQPTGGEWAAFARYNADGSLEQGFGGPPDAIASGTLSAFDPDASTGWVSTSGLWWSGSADGTYGRFTMGSGGAWSYQVDNSRPATQALAQGEAVLERFTATVTDGYGASAVEMVEVTLVGSNDAPLIG
jgi:uncharacterized delta-60 repeat protein